MGIAVEGDTPLFQLYDVPGSVVFYRDFFASRLFRIPNHSA